MGKVVSIVNSQDAVGKSTSAWYLAQSLSETGSKVLLIDCDPLSALASRIGDNAKSHVHELLLGKVTAAECITEMTSTVHLIAGSSDMLAFEIAGTAGEAYALRLSDSIKPVVDDYDYIVIDTPSSPGRLTVNALAASDSVLVPVCCDYFGMESVSEVMSTIARVRATYNARLQVAGMFITRYDTSLRSTSRNLKELTDLFGNVLMDTIIRESDDPKADYAHLTQELLHKKTLLDT